MNPYYSGLRVVDRDDFFPKAFSPEALATAYLSLTRNPKDAALILESPSFDEVDDYYNPGEDEVDEQFILEAVTVERFSRTEKRMLAVVRVLNNQLGDSEIKALPPVVGRPRKSGSFAYVIVQLPFSDGQTVSVVFHSPEGDKKRIAPSDTIIAFRWLLNKRDITHVVAPEEGTEISLIAIAKRVTQLVKKNSARFERQQKAASEEHKALEAAREAVTDAENKQSELMDAIVADSDSLDTIDASLTSAMKNLEKHKAVNVELETQISALMAVKKSMAGREESGASAQIGGDISPQQDTERSAAQNSNEQTEADLIKQINELPGVKSVNLWNGRHYINLRGNGGNFRGERNTKIYIDSNSQLHIDIGKGTCSSEYWEQADQVKAVCDLYNERKAGNGNPEASQSADPPEVENTSTQVEASAELETQLAADANIESQAEQQVEQVQSAPSLEQEQNEETVTAHNVSAQEEKVLDELISGKFDLDPNTFGRMLDDTAEKAEQIGVFAELEAKFNQAADRLTQLLKKRSA